MKILFVSDNCSYETYAQIDQERVIKLLPAQQNFYRLLLDGLVSISDCDIECLSAIPVSASCHNKKIWEYREERITPHLKYVYIPFVNTKYRRHITQFLSTYRLCVRWLKENENTKEKIILVDSIIMQCALAAKMTTKIYRCNIVGVVTDIAKYTTQILGKPQSHLKRIIRKCYDKFSDLAVKGLDGYIFLTEYMNKEINTSNKPYIVVEGISSDKFTADNRMPEGKNYVMYAGGIHEKFGVLKLAKAYAKLPVKWPLHIYGSGPDVDKIISMQNNNIKYMGVLGQEDIIKKEQGAKLLINPRPSDEEFTKFSFPSKTMEYMASGTAVLSTPLKGIPDEYRPYIFWFEDETEGGMASKIQEILSMQDADLLNKGNQAREFVLENKNYIKQGERVLQFLKRI